MSNQAPSSKKQKSPTSKFKTYIATALGIGLLGIVGWLTRDYWMLPSDKPFVVMKVWSETPGAEGKMSAGFEWIHRQCHENLADLDLEGRPRKKGAHDISRSDPRRWSFKLKPDAKWSDDGSPVTVQDYMRAWDLRKGVIGAQEFKRIKNLKSTYVVTIEVELDGEEDQKLDAAALSSIWLSPIKASTKGAWSIGRELEGPCDGPYVVRKKNAKEVLMVRNKNWHSYDPSLIGSVKILLNDGSDSTPATKQPPSELFSRGILSFVEPTVSANNTSAQVAVSGRIYLEPRAHYIVINPRGLVGGELLAFAHAAISRGELSALVKRPKTMSSMQRVLPLSFPAVDDSGQAIDLPPASHESVANANKLLGFKEKIIQTKIPPPFKRKLVILAKSEPDLDPVVQRFADRLGANYNISCEIVRPSADGKLPATWDAAFVDVDLGKGFGGWAHDMSQLLQKYAPNSSDMIGKFNALAKNKSEAAIPHQTLVEVLKLDDMAPKSSVLVPLGQFGSEVLIEDGVLGVSWIGDTKRDPDVSRARRITTRTKG